MSKRTSVRSEPPLKQVMNLKVLYTLDDETTFLGRSIKPMLVRVVEVPDSGIRIGAVDLKKCLQIVVLASPELVSDRFDLSCYCKDISEPDEPYVGHGMLSVLKDKKGENLVPGRVCSSFASLLGGSNSNETLEIKLKLLKIHSKKRSSLQLDLQQENTSSESEDYNFTAPQGKYYKRSTSSQPIKASRTKSLPASYHIKLQQQQSQLQQQQQQQQHKKILPNLSRRMNSISVIPQSSGSSPIPDIPVFQDSKPKDEKKRPKCLECGTNESKTWKVIKKPSKQLQYKTGLLCNDCNASMLTSGLSRNSTAQHPQHHQQSSSSSSPSIPNLNNVDISDIFNSEYDISRFGGPLTDIDPLPPQLQQLTPVDEPSRATRLNTTLIDMDEDKENVQPVSTANSPNKPISLILSDKDLTDFEKIIAESFHEFSVPSPQGKGWLNVLFAHPEEDEHHVEQDTDYNHKYGKSPENSKFKSILSSPPMYTTPYKDDIDKLHTSILTSINDDISSLANWSNQKLSPPTSFLEDDETEDEK